MAERARGHRTRAHTADIILEAWGTDLATCCEEAATALIETFLMRPAPGSAGERHVRLEGGPAESLLIATLEEVIFSLDTAEGIPESVAVREAGGGLELVLGLADPSTVEGTGSVPKAISRSGLRVTSRPGKVACRVLVDV